VGGQVASAIAVERVREVYLAIPSEDPNESLRVALSDAHAAIQEHARQNPELMGHGHHAAPARWCEIGSFTTGTSGIAGFT